MPHLPRLERKPYKRVNKRKGSGKQELYQSAKWKRFTKLYRENNPLCEASKHTGQLVDITPGGRKGATDHIIRIVDGGAEYDERNLMGLSRAFHDKKTRMERDGAFFDIEYEFNNLGEKVPTRVGREMALQILTGRGH